jgi:hypothetical protein
MAKKPQTAELWFNGFPGEWSFTIVCNRDLIVENKRLYKRRSTARQAAYVNWARYGNAKIKLVEKQ